MAIVAPSHQGATLCYNQTSLIRIAILCLLISSAVQLSLPLINEYGKWLLFFAHSYVKCVLFTSCNNTTSQDFSLARQNDPTFFPEIFPVETWTGAKPVAIVPQISEDEVPDRAREQEALAALSAAQSSRRSGNIKRAKMIIEHAVALAPNHPDILTEYGLFHEMLEHNVLEADHCYAKALAYDPSHSEALVRRKRTLPLVNAMDAKLLRRIEAKRDQFARLPHTSALKRAMRESYFLHIYHTVAIEGNTLSLGQTRSILESGVAVAGKSIHEHNEVIGMDAALRYLNHSLLHSKEITLDDILEMHRRVLGNVNPIDAGRIRTTQVFVGRFTPVAPEYVKDQLDELVDWLRDPVTMEMSPIEKAAIAHYKLVVVHPFIDGNGRTARLLLNLILMRAGFPPVILPVESRAEYYATLITANHGDLRPFVRYIARHTESTLKFYIASAEACVPADCPDNELDGEENERIQSDG
uniref:protein adenylyltransferase n=1 Tax=Haemonchus contortus TaxID=6289 RepID=A0A7I4YN53_HAECO